MCTFYKHLKFNLKHIENNFEISNIRNEIDQINSANKKKQPLNWRDF